MLFCSSQASVCMLTPVTWLFETYLEQLPLTLPY